MRTRSFLPLLVLISVLTSACTPQRTIKNPPPPPPPPPKPEITEDVIPASNEAPVESGSDREEQMDTPQGWSKSTGDGPSCEEQVAKSGQVVTGNDPRLSSGTLLDACHIPAGTSLTICAVVEEGKASGVTVYQNSGNAVAGACLANKVRTMKFEPGHKDRVALTIYSSRIAQRSTAPTPPTTKESGSDRKSVAKGRLPAEVIRTIVRESFGRLRECYNEGLARNPSLKGQVSVRFVIARDGSVSNVGNGGSTMPDGEVTSCVISRFYEMKFPVPEGGIITVTYPIRFST